MSQMGLLFVLSEPPLAMDEELNEWYDHEHIPERLSIKGFISAKRYVSAARARRYLALYDIVNVEVLQSPEYKAFAGENFTPWTKRVVSRSKFTRSEAVQLLPGDQATAGGSRLLVIRFSDIDESLEAEIRRGAERCFLGKPEVNQMRMFRGHGDAQAREFLIVAGNGNLEALLDVAAFAQVATRIDLVETFLPY